MGKFKRQCIIYHLLFGTDSIQGFLLRRILFICSSSSCVICSIHLQAKQKIVPTYCLSHSTCNLSFLFGTDFHETSEKFHLRHSSLQGLLISMVSVPYVTVQREVVHIVLLYLILTHFYHYNPTKIFSKSSTVRN